MPSAGPKRYDAFLSYNSHDGEAVEALARRLRERGLGLYLEAWELLPGRKFQPGLAQALADSRTCVVCLGPNGLGPWQMEEIEVAIDRRVRMADFHVIPVLHPGAERPRRGAVAHLEFLINASWVEFPRTLEDPRAFDRLVAGITGIKPEPPPEEVRRWEGRRPYRGLEAFGRDDRDFFFGRENPPARGRHARIGRSGEPRYRVCGRQSVVGSQPGRPMGRTRHASRRQVEVHRQAEAEGRAHRGGL